MKLATFLLESKNEYNGHKQTELGEMTFDDLREVIEALQEESPEHLFFMKIFSDGSGSVEQGCYWREGEHPLGHVDRNIFGFQLMKDGSGGWK